MKVFVSYVRLKNGRVWHRIKDSTVFNSGAEAVCSGLMLLGEDTYTNRLDKDARLCKKCFRKGKVQ